jgi:5-methylcytosine-specific restriction endonuclease McrA
MARFSKEDKKNIARAQNQEVYEEYGIFGNSRLVGYKCKKCRRVFDLDILEVDHIKPQSRGGKDNPSNLQLLCPPCNKKKGSKIKTAGVKSTSSLIKKTTRKKPKPVRKTASKSRTKKKIATNKPKIIKKKIKSPVKRKIVRRKKTTATIKRRSATKKTNTTKRKKK